MKNFTVATIALAMTLALPLAAQAAQTAPVRKTEAQLKVDANVVKFCSDKGKSVATAKYANDTENKVTVTCNDDGAAMVGLGGLGLSTAAVAVTGVVFAAMVLGGNDSTPDTQ